MNTSQDYMAEVQNVLFPEPDVAEASPPETGESRESQDPAVLIDIALAAIERQQQEPLAGVQRDLQELAQGVGGLRADIAILLSRLPERRSRANGMAHGTRRFPPGASWDTVRAMFEEYGDEGTEALSRRYGFVQNSVNYFLRTYAAKAGRTEEYAAKKHQVYCRRTTIANETKRMQRGG